MSLPPIDELMAMTDQQKVDLLASELKGFFDSMEDPERRKRLEAMQWKLAMKTKHAPNHMASTLELSRMMHDSALDLYNVVNGVERMKPEGTVHTLKTKGTIHVLKV